MQSLAWWLLNKLIDQLPIGERILCSVVPLSISLNYCSMKKLHGLAPNHLVAKRISSVCLHWLRKISLEEHAILIPRKYFREPRFLMWKWVFKNCLSVTICWESLLVMIMSLTYTRIAMRLELIWSVKNE